MTLNQGDNATKGKFYPFQIFNWIKNHWRQSDPKTAVSNAQPGMILSDADDDKLWHRVTSGFDEILQETKSLDARPRFYLVHVEVEEAGVSDPPTEAELDGIFTSAATLGEGALVLLKNISSGGSLYLIASDGSSYYTSEFTKAV